MFWLLNLRAVQLLRAEIAPYCRVALWILIAFVAYLPSGTGMWMHARVIDAPHSAWGYPFTYLLPSSYTGKNVVLALYMLLLLGAGHLSLRAGLATPHIPHAYAAAKAPLRQYWIQGLAGLCTQRFSVSSRLYRCCRRILSSG